MLVDPSLDDLLNKVDNKFRLVTLALKRARQINDGNPLIEDYNAAKPVSMALQEINLGQVFIKEPGSDNVLQEAMQNAELSDEVSMALSAEADKAFAVIEQADQDASAKADEIDLSPLLAQSELEQGAYEG